MASQGTKGLKRIILAFGYSCQGFKAAYEYEEAFRQEIILAAITIPLAFYLAETGLECALLISSILLIMIAELLNTGIEAITDRVGTDHHELSGRAKDIGSAAVLLSLVNSTVIWVGVLFF